MAVITWANPTAASSRLAWLANLDAAMAGVSGWTVQAASVSKTTVPSLVDTAHRLSVYRCDNATRPFVVVVWVQAAATNTFQFAVAESYTAGVFTRPSQSVLAANATPNGSDDYFGGGTATWPVGATAPVSSGTPTGTAEGLRFYSGVTAFTLFTGANAWPTKAWVSDGFFCIDQGGSSTGGGTSATATAPIVLFAGLFDTALATPANDPYQVMCGYARTTVAQNLAACTRLPLLRTLSGTQTVNPGALVPWMSSEFTIAADPFNTANPTAYLFTPACLQHGAEVGGVLRGSTKNLLFCYAGVQGEQVTIPGEGVYEKVASASGLWLKVGAA